MLFSPPIILSITVKGLLPLLPNDLQKVLEADGIFSVSRKLNKDGEWEPAAKNDVIPNKDKVRNR